MKDLDFETYSVEAPRAQSIREQIQKLREQNWAENLRLLAVERGTDVIIENNGQFEAAIGESAKAFTAPAGHPAEGLVVTLSGHELKVRYLNTDILELTFLPKNNEFAVFFLDDTQWDVLVKLMESVTLEVEIAKKAKSEKQAAFRRKFSGESVVAEISAPAIEESPKA